MSEEPLRKLCRCVPTGMHPEEWVLRPLLKSHANPLSMPITLINQELHALSRGGPIPYYSAQARLGKKDRSASELIQGYLAHKQHPLLGPYSRTTRRELEGS